MHLAAVLTHYAVDDGEAEPGAYAHGFGGEKWIEDAREQGLRNSRAVVLHLQQHPAIAHPFGAHHNISAGALAFEGLPRVADQIHEHLLELSGVAFDKRQKRIEVQLDTHLFGGQAKTLQFHGARNNLVERDAATLWPRIPRGQKHLAQNGAGAIGLFKNLASFEGMPATVASQQQALRIAENGGER